MSGHPSLSNEPPASLCQGQTAHRSMLQKVFNICTRSRRNQTIASLAIIALATLAITVPFAGQAFSIDGPVVLEFAQRQIDQPFAQDLPDHFDDRGIFYDNYLDTHPKFLPLYLSLVIRIAGEPSEVPIHLSLVIFPFIGATGMFFLGRRFRAGGMSAALLFLVSPMLMVSSHFEMVDVPGTSLTVAAIAVFVSAVDRRSNWLLGLSTLLMILASQTFFQGLVVLPVALAYLVINRRFQLRNFIPIVSTGLFFGAYLLAVTTAYNQLPRFSYRPQLNTTRPDTSLAKTRGQLTVLGGTLLFPFITVIGFFTRWTSALIFVGSSAITWSWSVVKYVLGEYSFTEMVLLSIMLPAGITIAFLMLERFGEGIFSRESRNSRAGKDMVVLAVWFFGVLVSVTFLLPYPAPRYLLPIAPAAILGLLMFWRKYISTSRMRFGLAGAAIALTLVYATILSLSAYNNAWNGKAAAHWAVENYGNTNGSWYNGTFGFGYYLQRSGFRRTPSIENELHAQTIQPLPLEGPRPGDHVVYSILNGAWVPYPSVMQRLRGEKAVFLYNDQIFTMPCSGSDICWWESSFLPFSVDMTGGVSDVVMAWRIDDTPNPLDESQKELYREVGIPNIEEMSE